MREQVILGEDAYSTDELEERRSLKYLIAKFFTNAGAPPFTFLAASYLIGIGAASNPSVKAAAFSASFLSPNFFERSESLQRVSPLLQAQDIGALIGLVGGILPLIAIVLCRALGVVKSLDLDTLPERIVGFAFATSCGVILLPILQALEAPPLFFIFLYSHLLATFLLFLVTLYTMRFAWKASVHSGGAACLCFAAILCLKGFAWFWGPALIVIIAWSRLYLNRHTLSQVIFGGSLALVCYTAVFSIFDISLI